MKIKSVVVNGVQRRFFWMYFRKTLYALVIGVVGSLIGAYFQSKNWREQNELVMLESDRKQAEAIFAEVSSLMDDRYYKTSRFLSAYKQNDPVKIERYKESYIEQLEKWNSNRSRLNALLYGYYGKEFSYFFSVNIQDNFAKSGNRLAYLSNTITREDIVYIDSIMKIIQPQIFSLNRMMIESIKKDKIGRFIDKN